MEAEATTWLSSSDGGQQMLEMRATLLGRKQHSLISIQTLIPCGTTLILREKYIQTYICKPLIQQIITH